MSLPITKEYLKAQLKNLDTQVLEPKYLQDSLLKLEKLTTPSSTDYASTYELSIERGGVKTRIGDQINIPKDWMLKDLTIKTCATDDDPIAGLKVGDKYFDFEVNVDDAKTATSKHVYLKCADILSLEAGDAIAITGQKIGVNYGSDLRIGEAADGADKDKLTLKYDTVDIDFSDWATYTP